MHLLLVASPFHMSQKLFDFTYFLSIDQIFSRSEDSAAKSDAIQLQAQLLSKEVQLSEAKLAHEASVKQLKVDKEVVEYWKVHLYSGLVRTSMRLCQHSNVIIVVMTGLYYSLPNPVAAIVWWNCEYSVSSIVLLGVYNFLWGF